MIILWKAAGNICLTCKKERTISFEKIFDISENRIHAIFLFLNMLELIQQKYFFIIIGEGINNFIIELMKKEWKMWKVPNLSVVDPLQN